MARTATSPRKELINWDEELAKQAIAPAAAEAAASTSGRPFYNARAGVLSFNNEPLPHSQIGVIIVDAIFENIFYEGAFDASTPRPPTCFAFAREQGDLQPHTVVVEAGQDQNPTCDGCPRNEFGSADTGKGKACKNVRLLATIAAGEFDATGKIFHPYTDAEHFAQAPLVAIRVSVTSVKNYSAFVQQVFGGLMRPMHGIFSRIRVSPDVKTTQRFAFEALGKVPDNLMAAVMARRDEAKSFIEQPYLLTYDNDDAPVKETRGRKPLASVKKPLRKF